MTLVVSGASNKLFEARMPGFRVSQMQQNGDRNSFLLNYSQTANGDALATLQIQHVVHPELHPVRLRLEGVDDVGYLRSPVGSIGGRLGDGACLPAGSELDGEETCQLQLPSGP